MSMTFKKHDTEPTTATIEFMPEVFIVLTAQQALVLIEKNALAVGQS